MSYIIAIVSIVLWWLLSRRAAKGIKQIQTSALNEMLTQSGHIFIDVRTPAEYKANHIKQFRNMPLGLDMSVLSKEKNIVVICKSGMRSMQASKRLRKLGYTSVTNVQGGMSAWVGPIQS